ncbi:hypothetical protein PVIIG_05915 [Plasmodium vivax India VII]|uniref:Uncharacterized protein n=1 Tax=Plasmodium vivax India VII TaxID=1077284 RepID=A0A0J9S1L0_PLAVI|nr:hypothetical protein PVIIG_05915 [Plasmodium vivax India VII]
MYEQFDKPLDNIDRKKKIYEGMCKLFISSMGKKEEDYLDFCMKYLRNLDPYCIYPNICKNNSERCNNLNYWLYDSIVKKKLDNKVISNFYDKTMSYVSNRHNKFMCYYYSYDECFREPENILKLLNFQSNINIIEQILKDRDHEHYCFCEKYIYECVNIYKKMHNTYCSTSTISDSIDNATCNNLRTFSSIYSIFLSSVQNFNDKIPTLDLKNNEFLIECSIKKKEPEPLSDRNDNPDSSISLTVQRTLGTAAGISSLLAVLYKVNANTYLNILTTRKTDKQ